jgi:peptide deformylase
MQVVVPDEYKHLYVTNSDRPIVKIPDPVLRKVAQEITRITPRVKVFADAMVRAMRSQHGVGLAAPQLGVSERMVVVAPDHRPLVLINPEILSQEGSEVYEEGCLSIPGLYGDVERSTLVVVRAFDRRGREMEYEFEGMAARIVLHEIDHLDGILFIDKVDPATLHWSMPSHEVESVR